MLVLLRYRIIKQASSSFLDLYFCKRWHMRRKWYAQLVAMTSKWSGPQNTYYYPLTGRKECQ